jgi:hypothetical protein
VPECGLGSNRVKTLAAPETQLMIEGEA